MINIGENCILISREAPVSFWQALQLVWFVQIFLHAESKASAVSFGRLDQYIWPFYSRDVMNGTLTPEFALELIECFYIKASEGDESQNLIVGGMDACGNNVENELSLLYLRAAREVQLRQPSLSVRIAPDNRMLSGRKHLN